MGRFCRDCVHAKKTDSARPDNWECKSPNNFKWENPVSGSREYEVSTCTALRLGPTPKYCGPDGAWFEPVAVSSLEKKS